MASETQAMTERERLEDAWIAGYGCAHGYGQIDLTLGESLAGRYVDALLTQEQPASEGEDRGRIYPCRDCGVMRTRAEGGLIFSVCDECWKNVYPPEDIPEDDPLWDPGKSPERYWCGCVRHARWERCEDHGGLGHDEEPPTQKEAASTTEGERGILWKALKFAVRHGPRCQCKGCLDILALLTEPTEQPGERPYDCAACGIVKGCDDDECCPQCGHDVFLLDRRKPTERGEDDE